MSKDPSSAEMEVGVLREEVRRLNDIIEHLNREWGPQVARLEREVEGYTTLIENINLLGGLERERLEGRIQILEQALQQALPILNGIDYEEGSRVDQAVTIMEAARGELVIDVAKLTEESWHQKAQQLQRALDDAVDVAIWLTGAADLSSYEAWPAMRERLNAALTHARRPAEEDAV